MQEHSEANEKWKNQLQYFQQSNGYKELFGIDEEPIELEWNFSRTHDIADSQRDSGENGSLSNKSRKF